MAARAGDHIKKRRKTDAAMWGDHGSGLGAKVIGDEEEGLGKPPLLGEKGGMGNGGHARGHSRKAPRLLSHRH